MKAKGQVEDVFCRECNEVRACEVTSVASGGRGRGIGTVRYLCSREHRFEIYVKAPGPMFPRKRKR